MRSIKFTAPWDDRRITVSLSEVHGMGGSWHIMTDSRFDGSIRFTENYGWQWWLNANSELSYDDVMVLIDLIEGRDSIP